MLCRAKRPLTLLRRLRDMLAPGGGLLIGVGSQVGRPLSLAHEWAPLAKQVLDAEARRSGGAIPVPQPTEEVDVPLQRRPSRTLRLLKETVSGQ